MVFLPFPGDLRERLSGELIGDVDERMERQPSNTDLLMSLRIRK